MLPPPIGKPLTITDGNGTNVANNASHIANLNPLRYRSYVYDNESGFYYLMSRYYDPTTGRFLSPDSQLNLSTMHGCNLYAYCENDPVNYVDDSGAAPRPLYARIITDGIKAAVVLPEGIIEGITGTYNELRYALRKGGIKGYEVHHLIEIRFYDVRGLGKYTNMTGRAPSIILSKQAHRSITNAIRKDFAYGSQYTEMEAKQIGKYFEELYERYGLDRLLLADYFN